MITNIFLIEINSIVIRIEMNEIDLIGCILGSIRNMHKVIEIIPINKISEIRVSFKSCNIF
jgi:hypothetical protein